MSRFISPDVIERTATRLRKSAGITSETNYVNIGQVAEHFGCKVELVEFTPPTVSARITRSIDPDYEYLIQVNASDSRGRRRFSIAHELAHAVLHDDGSDFEFVEHRKPKSEYNPSQAYREVQANMLASAILMPQAAVMRFWRHDDDLDDLAAEFQVSRDAAFWRASNLDLLND